MNDDSRPGRATPQLRVIEGGGVREQATPSLLLPERPRLQEFDRRDYPIMSDARAWREWPVTASALKCRTAKLRGVHWTTGQDWARGLPCRTWGHQDCAVKKAENKLELFATGAERLEAVYFAVSPTMEFSSARLSDRLRRLREYRDDGYLWVKRSDDQKAYTFASCDLSGIEPPQFTPVSPAVAMGLCVAALRLPGVEHVDRSARWPDPTSQEGREDRDPTSEMFGIYRDADWGAVLDEAVRIAQRIHGVEVNVAYPVVKGITRGWTTAKWIDCIKTAVKALGCG